MKQHVCALVTGAESVRRMEIGMLRSQDGRTCLFWACWHGHTSTAEMLLDKGAEFKAKDDGGLTCLHVACEHGHTSTAEMLVSYGADPESTSVQGETPEGLLRAKGKAVPDWTRPSPAIRRLVRHLSETRAELASTRAELARHKEESAAELTSTRAELASTRAELARHKEESAAELARHKDQSAAQLARYQEETASLLEALRRRMDDLEEHAAADL